MHQRWARHVFAIAALAAASEARFVVQAQQEPHDEARFGPLPRWRDGGVPDDPNQLLVPFAVTAPAGPEMPPQGGLIASPPEYSPTDGVLFRYSTSAWPSVVVDCVVALTASPTHTEKAYVVVSSSSAATSAAATFQSAGADLSKVVFVIEPTDSIWLRDYGPHFVWQSGALVIADSHYYPTRPLDNFIPTLLAGDSFFVPAYAMGLYYSGGNFQPGPNRSGFITSLINTDNPEMTAPEIADLYRAYQGIDTLHVMPRLPSTVDGTGHIDMWMYLVDDHTVIVSQFKAGSNATAIQITDAAVGYMQALGFNVFRTPAWNSGGTHYTYTNAFRVNDRIFVPIYGPGNSAYLADDQAALAAWSSAAGAGVQIVPIDCYSIIPAAGAIHCIVMQVPRVTPLAPSAHVTWPAGGEVLAVKQSYPIRWAASDDEGVTSIDLAYSIDGGQTFPFTIAQGIANTGVRNWNVPLRAATQAVIRLVAHDVRGNSTTVYSAPFQILRARRATYDFASNAGVDRWAWGSQTTAWTELAGVRHPATAATALTTAQYAALSTSNATGGDTDVNRYISPIPSSSRESTHLFEFTVEYAPANVRALEFVWEGYGDQCVQLELYVWDNASLDWCDLRGNLGLNRYAANFSGNRDELLTAHVSTNLTRYLDSQNRVTFLLYADRSAQESFHDYAALRVVHN